MLLEVLQRVEADGRPFSLESWVWVSPNLHECGTVCCAVGWAAQDRRMNKEGLHLVRHSTDASGKIVGNRWISVTDLPKAAAGQHWGPEGTYVIMPAFLEAIGFDAVEAFFGISRDQACWLFASYRYPRENATKIGEVIERVQAMMAGGEDVP